MPTSQHTMLADLDPFKKDLVALRHHLHQHPELAFEENATAQLVADRLRDDGYTVHTGLAGTGVVGTLRVGEGTRRLGLRADLDALPIHESNTFEHASRHAGTMHACGHDGHTAMLLGAARYLAQTQRFNGTLNLIFQPAEERGFDSGAKRMVEQGLFDQFPCDAVFGMHNYPGHPTGSLLFRQGAMLAAGDRAFVTLTGQGGHAARAHETRDPVVAAASVVMALQTIVSRNVSVLEPAVVSVGSINGGCAPNVIPDQVKLSLSIRAFSESTRQLLKRRIREIVQTQAESLGVDAEIDYIDGYPVTYNHADETTFAVEVARELLGDEQVVSDLEPVMGSEDFSYMLQQCPGCFIMIGNGSDAGGRVLHSPSFDFNNDNLTVGAAYWARLTERYLV